MASLASTDSIPIAIQRPHSPHQRPAQGLRPCRRATFLCAVLIAAAAAVAYHNSFNVPLIFDDRNWIVENPTIRDLSDIRRIIFPERANLFGARPVLSLSLALNYWLRGTEVR